MFQAELEIYVNVVDNDPQQVTHGRHGAELLVHKAKFISAKGKGVVKQVRNNWFTFRPVLYLLKPAESGTTRMKCNLWQTFKTKKADK